MADSQLSALYSQIDSLPSLPTIVTRVMEVTSDSESSANDLMQAVLPDQSMCALILKIANSAFFGFPKKVSTIEKAVMVLGFSEIRNIVLGKAVFNCFRDLERGNKAEITTFWAHSFLCGLGAKIIAEDLGHSPSELFIGGLLHDIGKLAMLITLGGDYIHLLELRGPKHPRSILEEKELFTIGHDEVALKILKKWLFPEQLTQAIGYHHTPNISPGSPMPSAIIQMADILALILHEPDEMESNEVSVLLHDYYPETVTLWKENKVSYEDRLITWLKNIESSLEKDAAILEIFTS